MSIEPIVGRCYRYISNKYYLGKYLGKEEWEGWVSEGQHSTVSKPHKQTLYKFTKMQIGPASLNNIEETSCESRNNNVKKGGSRKKTRRYKKLKKNSRKHRY